MNAGANAVANPSEERIDFLTRENRHLQSDNTKLRVFNESLQKLMKRVEGQLSKWRGSYMRQGR
jgi:hypothetical protein